MINKTTDLCEKLKNKLEYVVRYYTSHIRFYEYISFILLYFFVEKFCYSPPKRKKIHGKREKVKVISQHALIYFLSYYKNQLNILI